MPTSLFLSFCRRLLLLRRFFLATLRWVKLLKPKEPLSVSFSAKYRRGSLSIVINFWAGIDRLYTFAEYLEQPEITQTADQDQKPTITTVQADRVALEHLTLQTPNYQRTLVEDLSVEFPLGKACWW